MAAPVHLVVSVSGRRFVATAQVKLDATGVGQAMVSPAGVDWVTETITVSTSTSTLQPIASLYLDGVGQGGFLEGTFTGSRDTTDTSHLVQAGQQLICAWSGGDVGATAWLRVAGTSYPAGQGAT